MYTTSYLFFTILGCGLATWLSRVLPFLFIKRMNFSQPVAEFLRFVPIVIMSALWFNSLFVQNLGHLPSIDWENLLASLPTVLSAIISKNLLVIVIVGMISLAALRFFIL